mmetsp:Transcript_38001/g.68745  ORF Transcript_38001/g.68745 Transcript_38001/m.68745 type:complete len:400 (+) Transcript_38001:90-1289(+)
MLCRFFCFFFCPNSFLSYYYILLPASTNNYFSHITVVVVASFITNTFFPCLLIFTSLDDLDSTYIIGPTSSSAWMLLLLILHPPCTAHPPPHTILRASHTILHLTFMHDGGTHLISFEASTLHHRGNAGSHFVLSDTQATVPRPRPVPPPPWRHRRLRAALSPLPRQRSPGAPAPGARAGDGPLRRRGGGGGGAVAGPEGEGQPQLPLSPLCVHAVWIRQSVPSSIGICVYPFALSILAFGRRRGSGGSGQAQGGLEGHGHAADEVVQAHRLLVHDGDQQGRVFGNTAVHLHHFVPHWRRGVVLAGGLEVDPLHSPGGAPLGRPQTQHAVGVRGAREHVHHRQVPRRAHRHLQIADGRQRCSGTGRFALCPRPRLALRPRSLGTAWRRGHAVLVGLDAQ